MKIKNIHSMEILDSRGIPTISTEIELWSGDKGKSEVPSGASTGSSEVLELRDGDMQRYNGQGVLKAVENINGTIFNALKDKDFDSQKSFDDFLISLDGTELKTNLGGNTLLSCSMAFCRAVSNSLGIQLYEYFGMIYWGDSYNPNQLIMPNPLVLIMEGGKHGNWATDIQEYMIAPSLKKFGSYGKAFESSVEVFHKLHDILDSKGYSATVGFEGAYAPKELASNKEAFDLITRAVEDAGFKLGDDFVLALDFASSEFYDTQKIKYILKRENKELSPSEWIDLQKEWYSQYPIFSTEDPLNQDDWSNWTVLMNEVGNNMQVVGDDLLTTNTKRIQKGIDEKCMNAVIIKLNQIGTVSETLNAIRMCVDNNMEAIISHRGGETNDDMIADLVIGTPANQCKFGGPDRGERLSKYNRLLEIEELLKR